MKSRDSIWLKYHPELADRDYPDCSMFEFLKETADKYPSYTALEFYGKKTSFSRLIRQIADFSEALRKLGVGKGDYVSVVSPNTPQALISVYALNRLGAIANVLHPLLSAEELQRACEEVHSTVVITLDSIYPKLAKIQWSPGNVPVFVLARVVDALPVAKKPFYRMKNGKAMPPWSEYTVFRWKDLNGKKNMGLEPEPGSGDDVAVILYSGGTTGKPKGVMLTNSNFNCLSVQAAEASAETSLPGHRALAVMPIFHGFGLGLSMHGMLCRGISVFLVPEFDMQACTRLIFQKKINYLFGVPAFYEALSRSVEIEKKDCGFLRFMLTAGDKPSPAMVRRLDSKLEKGGSSARLLEAFGLTETAAGGCVNPYFYRKEGSAGLPLSDMKVKICREGTQEELPAGETGEICISGPTVMKGYLNNEEATRLALQCHKDGLLWLHTGDMGYLDRDGYLFFMQRKAGMIITAGYNVYPSEVEAAIVSSGIVKVCCVVGKKDRVLGERVKAFVVLNDRTEQAEAKKRILEACEQKTASYAVPKEIVFLDELPVSSLGKTDFKKLETM